MLTFNCFFSHSKNILWCISEFRIKYFFINNCFFLKVSFFLRRILDNRYYLTCKVGIVGGMTEMLNMKFCIFIMMIIMKMMFMMMLIIMMSTINDVISAWCPAYQNRYKEKTPKPFTSNIWVINWIRPIKNFSETVFLWSFKLQYFQKSFSINSVCSQ